MIKTSQSFITSDEKLWPTLEEAQTHELFSLVAGQLKPSDERTQAEEHAAIAKMIFENANAIAAIMSIEPEPAKRKYQRKKKTAPATIQHSETAA